MREAAKVFALILLFFTSLLYSQINIDAQPQLGTSSWIIPVKVKVELSPSLTIHQRSMVFNTDFPFNRFQWYSYTRNKKSFLTETSYFKYKNEVFSIEVGRAYLNGGPGKLSGLFISPISPPLDHVRFAIENFNNFQFSNSIIRLDNRETSWAGNNEITQRWMYIRSIGYSFKNFTFNLNDAVISTGFNRGIEWYYLNPLSSLFMERKHQYIWREGGDSTTVVGIGDNDNHFIGGDWTFRFEQNSLYGEWLIDEWQLSGDYRDNMQTVFGLIVGYQIQKNSTALSIEYALGSPWLYLSRGLYSSPEYHGLPLGLRYPNIQSIGLTVDHNFSEKSTINFDLKFIQKGDQSLRTKWNAWDNKIDVYSFNTTKPLEFKLVINLIKGKYFNKLGIFHNWLGTNSTHLFIGWDFKTTINSYFFY